MMHSSGLASVLADFALVEAMVPWPCPSVFRPEPRYELIELVGATRQSLVYRARDTLLSSDRHESSVAIKITRGGREGPHEALLGCRVSHEHVVRVLGRGEVDGCGYIVMEYLDAGTLGEMAVPMKPLRAAVLVEQVARGVAALHAAGVCHRDLKPRNVLLDANGSPKVTDFGLAVENDRAGEAESAGTLAFMAPEQFRGEPSTTAADIYALGGVLYFLLTGEAPNGKDRTKAETRLREGIAVDCSAIRRPLREICERAMSPNAADRHETAAHFAEELSAWRAHLPVASARPGWLTRVGLAAWRRPGRTAVVVSLAMLLVSGVVLAARDHELQLQAERDSTRLANEKLEEIKARSRALIRRMAYMTNITPSPNPSEAVLPVMVWMEWLTAQDVITELGEIELAEQRAPGLENMLLQYELLERGNSVAAGLTRYALAQSLLEMGAFDRVPGVLDRLEASWPGERDGGDAFWVSIDAMRAASVVLFGVDQAGSATDEQIARLDEIREPLWTQPDGRATYQLLKRVRDRLRPPPPAGT